MVLDAQADQPIGILTEADIARAVADGKDVNSVRIYELMTTRPTVITTTTSVRDGGPGHDERPFPASAGRRRRRPGRHSSTSPDVCRVLLETDVSPLPAGMT